MGKIKRLVLVSLTGISGLLLTFAGLNLIEISKELILYTGIVLLFVAILSYLFSGRSDKRGDGEM